MDSLSSSSRPTVAVIGGGQLARMMAESASALGIHMRALVEAADGSAGQVIVDAPVAMPSDEDAVRALVEGADVLTFEHEHIPAHILEELRGKISIHPKASALLYAQDKLAMRERLSALGIPCPAWAKVETPDDLQRFGDKIGWPIVVKTPRGGYDGHGVAVVSSPEEIEDWWGNGPLLAEEKILFDAELSALLARTPSGQIASWPLSSTFQANGVCESSMTPARGLTPRLAQRAREIAEQIAEELDVTGVLAVEMFLIDEDGTQYVVVNELAMRPHNTGHWTIDGSVTSQFEQHLRAVLDLPLGSTDMIAPNVNAIMVNLLGSDLEDPASALHEALHDGGGKARIHLYGKEVRPGRKLGHVTVVDSNIDLAYECAQRAVRALQGHPHSAPSH